MAQTRILIVEDDADTAQAIASAVDSLGCEPVVMRSFDAGLEAATLADFAVIVLDRMLPGGDGIDAIPRLRAKGSTALILVVSALGRAANKIEGLDRGADDYLAKPFEPDELKARLRALLRRKTIAVLDNDLIAFADVQIRLKSRTVHIGSDHIPVSPREFDLILYLAQNAGQIVTRMQLLEHVWNLHFDPSTNVVDVHVGRLRRKLEAAAGRQIIQTARGEGYIFAPTTASHPAAPRQSQEHPAWALPAKSPAPTDLVRPGADQPDAQSGSPESPANASAPSTHPISAGTPRATGAKTIPE